MRVFPVDESEIISLSMLNDLTTGFFSGASTAFILSIGIIIDMALQGQYWGNYSTELGRIFLCLLFPILAVVAVILLVCGIWTLKKRSSIWDNIRKSCIEIDSK